MAPRILLLIFAFLSAMEVQAQHNDSNIINLGSSLSPKTNSSAWLSASGLFSFGFHEKDDGFAVGIRLKDGDEGTIVWAPNLNGSSVSSDSVIELTKDGQLVLRNAKQMEEVFSFFWYEAIDSASMLDSGNFVLYDKNFSVIWQSFDDPSDTLLGGQNLTSGQALISANGQFALEFDDSALVARTQQTNDIYWTSKAFVRLYDYELNLNLTGFLCLYVGSKTVVLADGSNYQGRNTSLIYRATMDLDGIFRLYVHAFGHVQLVWQMVSSQCEVRGICGFNSYCSMDGGEAVCECFPGFMHINGNKSLFSDCQQISNDDCKTSKNPKMYDIVTLGDVQLNLIPYLVISLEMEACKRSCQVDCDCGAAIHIDGSCKKYSLPLKFGRIDHSISTTAFFKTPPTNVTPSNPKTKFQNLILTLVIILGSISFLCLAFATSIFFIYKHKVNSYTKLSATKENLGFVDDCSIRKFAFDELVCSTGNFTEEIGRGSFGVVYKGIIQGNNRTIVVKRLENVGEGAEGEFHAEITAIARTHHINLVQLIGYCIDGSRKLLVYEYMSNGSLADFLFKAEMHLSWKQRVKIALDVAKGILYLHEECEVCIVHCNIKPQNILLDEIWTAKISDFGLARLSMPETNELTSAYVAPERQKNALLASVKVDIYSFGVVLLEIICCRRNIDVKVASEEEIMLSSWVYSCFVKGELKKLVVDEDVEWKTLERMVKVALWCVQEDLSLRPSMKNVILMLEGLRDIPIPPSPIPLVCLS